MASFASTVISEFNPISRTRRSTSGSRAKWRERRPTRAVTVDFSTLSSFYRTHLSPSFYIMCVQPALNIYIFLKFYVTTYAKIHKHITSLQSHIQKCKFTFLEKKTQRSFICTISSITFLTNFMTSPGNL